MPQTPDLPMRKYDADLVERLQRIHKTGNGNREQKKTGERRNQLFEQLQITDEEFLASYEFIRDAYIQRRNNLVQNGNVADVDYDEGQ